MDRPRSAWPPSWEAAADALVAALRAVVTGPEPPRPPRRPRRPTRLAVVLAVLAGVIAVAMVNVLHELLLDVPAIAFVPLAALIAAPVALLATRPLTAWRIAWVVMLGTGLLDLAPDASPWPWHAVQLWVFATALLAVALQAGRLVTLWACLLTVAELSLFVRADTLPALILGAATIAFVGDQIRSRRDAQRALAAREQRSATELARLALLEQRQRISRELHDVVAHHMSLVAVRAETAPFRLPDVPPATRDEFASIAATARDALTEMRRLLDVLRHEHAELARMPQPSLGDLDELVDSVRASGVTVTVERVGVLDPVSAAVGLSAYRIVQEALSNARRHAPGAAVRVELRGKEQVLSVLVVNGPPAHAGAGAAAVTAAVAAAAGRDGPERHGLVGMRERATMLGGRFAAGPTSDGGYRVHAVLPRG